MCPDCEARRKLARDAFLNAKFAEALAHVGKGAAEIVGIREKTGAAELEASEAEEYSEEYEVSED